MIRREERDQLTDGSAAPAPARSRVGVLGPITADVDGGPRPVAGRRPRALLAYLALHPGEAVSADRLLTEVWGDDLPATGARAVAYQIAKLRSLLEPDRTGEGTLITTTPAGYTLHVDDDDVDALRFEQQVDEARTTLPNDPAGSEERTTKALALWRGNPFAELENEPFVERETRRLDQLRLAARRTVAEARIALGRPDETITDLEQLVDEHPLEESLVALAMTALHRAGRTADALRAYAELRRQLSTELGIEPSTELQRLEQQLLTDQDDEPLTPTPSRVPAAPTSFVGRTDELEEISDWMASSRLITLCGFGGLGKTRLAQEFARSMADRFADGVWFVDLAPVADPALVGDTIITAGGLTVPRDRDPVAHLLERLADAECLLVLDNCEHLVASVGEIAERIVRQAPHVRVLATSRVHLGVPDEAIFAVRPLDQRAATDLFADRARLARPGFTVDDADRAVIHRLVERLDGIPLAIEMAASRVAVISVGQIAEHLDDRLELLSGTARDQDARQRSLAAVMDWSFQLLDPAERRLLMRSSVCVGGFDLDAAVHIGVPEPDASFSEVIDRLERLVHASLVIVDGDDDPPRYRILEPIRQHAGAGLTAEERDAAALAHAQHYAAVASGSFALWSSDHLAAQEIGDREVGNLRAAMSWCYRHDRPHLGLTIARNARSHFFVNQMYRELLSWLQAGLDLIGDDDDDTLEALAVACAAAADLADRDALGAAFERLQQGINSVRDPRLRAELLSARAGCLLATDPRAAERDMRSAIEMRSSVPIRTLAMLNNRIDQSWVVGSLDDGAILLGRCEDVIATMSSAEPTRYKIEAGVAACDERWADVLRVADAAEQLNPMLESSVLTLQAEALSALGRDSEALAVLATVDPDSYERHRRYADRVHAAIDLRRGEPLAAAERLAALTDEMTRDGRRLAAGMHVASLLGVAATDLGQHEAAAILFGFAAAEQDRLDITLRPSHRPLAERSIETCRTALGPERFAELAAEGATTAWSDLPRPTPDAT